MISYSQNREDVLLNRLFPERSSGFYIDVGACYPVIHSVTKLFYDRGWRGINIEPLPSLSAVLTNDRPRDINLRMGLSNCEGISTLFECPVSPELSTFSDAQAEALRGQGFDLVERSIPVTTLAWVCEQHAGCTIDFLKIDVESYEREVLEGADWSRYRPRVVLVESTRPATNIPSHEQWEPLLLAADYLFAFFDGLNRYYVRVEDRHLLPLLAVPANVFDEYEIYEYHEQIQELRHALSVTEDSLGKTLTALDTSRAALGKTQNDLAEMRRLWDQAQFALHEARTQSETTRARLDASGARLEASEAQLEATRAQLAPFQELGPIAISVARRLRRMSNESPKLASIAKRFIRRAHQRARPLVPGA